MNKRIIIGSILVLLLLLLMPSIPATQNKVVMDEMFKIPEDLNLEEIKELLESGNLDRVKHPILGLLVFLWTRFRFLRFGIIASIAYDSYDFEWGIELDIHHPILFLRCFILAINTGLLIAFFNVLSYLLGWNWEIPY